MKLIWSPGMSIDQVEQELIEYSMRMFAGDKKKVAEAVGISLRSVEYKLKRYEQKRQADEDKEIADFERSRKVL